MISNFNFILLLWLFKFLDNLNLILRTTRNENYRKNLYFSVDDFNLIHQFLRNLYQLLIKI